MSPPTKPFPCAGCNKGFLTDAARKEHCIAKQHPATAPTMAVQCPKCLSAFGSTESLKQHTRDAHGKKDSFACDTCDKRFKLADGLADHCKATKHTPASSTKPDPTCGGCDKKFKTKAALQAHCKAKQHQQQPNHHRCAQCTLTFPTQQALEKHYEESFHSSQSDVNTPSSSRDGSLTPLLQRDASQAPGTSLNKAMKVLVIADDEDSDDDDDDDAAVLIRSRKSPLDGFFNSFGDFDYNPALCAATTFAQLRKKHGVAGYGTADRLRSQFHKALDMELELHYGDRDNLEAYQRMCREVAGIEASKSMTACKKSLNKIHINIFHLVTFARETAKWIAAGSTGPKPKLRIFDSISQLRTYCKNNKKKFPLAGGAQFNGDRSAALNAFLRMFRY